VLHSCEAQPKNRLRKKGVNEAPSPLMFPTVKRGGKGWAVPLKKTNWIIGFLASAKIYD
jgi:hypothetical protein